MNGLGEVGLWSAFVVGVILLVFLDLRLSSRNHDAPTPRRAAIWSALWIGLSIVFGIGILVFRGAEDGAQFFTAYLVEKALSFDNLMVFLLLFDSFEVPTGE